MLLHVLYVGFVPEINLFVFVTLQFDRAHLSLYGELRFSERKGFKKFYFEFSQYKLMYHKDTKVGFILSAVAKCNKL